MAIKKRPDESIDSMLRRFKRETLKFGIMNELRKREFYVSPSEKKRTKREEARRNALRRANKQN